MTPQEIAREALYERFPYLRTGLSADMVEVDDIAALILTAAARMVRESGAEQALLESSTQLWHAFEAKRYQGTNLQPWLKFARDKNDAALAKLRAIGEQQP